MQGRPLDDRGNDHVVGFTRGITLHCQSKAMDESVDDIKAFTLKKGSSNCITYSYNKHPLSRTRFNTTLVLVSSLLRFLLGIMVALQIVIVCGS